MSKRDFKHHPDTRFQPLDELSREEAREGFEALRDAVAYHDHLYYGEILDEEQFEELAAR